MSMNVFENRNLAYFSAPESWITKDMPPTLIQAGAADVIVPIACARGMAERIAEVCGPGRVEYDEFPDYGHGDPRFSSDVNITRMIDWLKSVLL